MSKNIVSTPTHERCVTSYAARTQYKPGVVHPPHIKVKDAIDIHCHAHEGQQDPYDLARRASLAEMKGLLFKSIPGDDPVKATQAVQDDVNRWAEKEEGVTRIGNYNFFMACCHVAHDCKLGNHIIMANAATLAGHVTIEDYATIGAFSGVHQFCRVGVHGFVGGYSVITKDVLPYSKTVSARDARSYGVNTIGLERRGFSADSIRSIRSAYRVILQSKLNTSQALSVLRERFTDQPSVQVLIDFIEKSQRGIIK
jgi:carbonic anhydrase/acetyltransferase-like protein (isoleucine patch superfamily)